MSNNTCLIVTGEKSGEEHVLSFFPKLKKLCPDTQFYGVVGEDLEREGVEKIYDLKDFSVMGFSEVLLKVPFFYKAIQKLASLSQNKKTNCAILVDYQDFNMALAKRLKRQGVNVLLYVAPQAWAWKSYRTHYLKRNLHTLFSILPFEKKWFGDRGVENIISVPHPVFKKYQSRILDLPEKKINKQKKVKVLLLPGSRKGEVSRQLPIYKEAILRLKKTYDLEVSICKSSSVEQNLFSDIQEFVDIEYNDHDLEDALEKTELCLAASGTVTLTCGLFQVPTIVTYKTSFLNEFIFYTFVNYLGYASLTNLLAEKEVFPELLQQEANVENIVLLTKKLIEDPKRYESVVNSLKELSKTLSGDDVDLAKYISEVIN